jgi:hypothetical protein
MICVGTFQVWGSKCKSCLQISDTFWQIYWFLYTWFLCTLVFSRFFPEINYILPPDPEWAMGKRVPLHSYKQTLFVGQKLFLNKLPSETVG